jgi:type IV secretory pathway VirD2 relaxase
MQTYSTKPARHALDLTPTHVKQQRASLKKAVRRKTIANSVPTLATGSFASYMGRHNQRCIVKISYTKNSKTRSWAAHGEYLQREHAQNIHEKGRGFNQESNAIDLKITLRQWQRDEDEHVFKLIVSPENGHQMDLKKHTKELIMQMEKDLKTRLEWAAIDHYNTDHPHLHILIRGRDQRGNTLVIERDYLSRGIRHRSQELATLVLGLRLNHDRVLARKKQLECEYVTEIDRSLRYKAVNSIVSFTQPVSDNLTARELRLLEIERLKFLEKLGLVEKIGKKEWKLSDNLEPTLREMQLSHDIIKSRARHNIQTLTHELPAPTQIQEHQPLTGKVVGMGLEDELRDRRYLLLEGTDGKIHYIQATNSIVKAKDNFEFANGNVITLEKKKFINIEHKPFEHIQVHNHDTLKHLQCMPSSRLDRDVVEFVKTHGIEPKPHFPTQSFAHEYAGAMTKRFHELVKEKIIIQEQSHHRLALDWHRQLSRVIKEREKTLHLQHTYSLAGHHIGKNKSHRLKLSR